MFNCGPIDVKITKGHKQVTIGSTARKNNVGNQHHSQHVDGSNNSHSALVFYINAPCTIRYHKLTLLAQYCSLASRQRSISPLILLRGWKGMSVRNRKCLCAKKPTFHDDMIWMSTKIPFPKEFGPKPRRLWYRDVPCNIYLELRPESSL